MATVAAREAEQVAAADDSPATDDAPAPAVPLSPAAEEARRDENLVAELDERAEELKDIGKHLDLYVRHLLRKALSHTITPSCLEELKTHLTRMHIIVDYKSKVLPFLY